MESSLKHWFEHVYPGIMLQLSQLSQGTTVLSVSVPWRDYSHILDTFAQKTRATHLTMKLDDDQWYLVFKGKNGLVWSAPCESKHSVMPLKGASASVLFPQEVSEMHLKHSITTYCGKCATCKAELLTGLLCKECQDKNLLFCNQQCLDKSGHARKCAVIRRQCSYCNVSNSATDKPMKKCSRCESVRYCSSECQLKHWNAGHKDKCVALDSKLESSATASSSQPACAVCHATEKLRTCSRCLKTQYCSKDCQNLHWIVHKLYCTSMD